MSFDIDKYNTELTLRSENFGNTEKLLIKLIDKMDELIAAVQAAP